MPNLRRFRPRPLSEKKPIINALALPGALAVALFVQPALAGEDYTLEIDGVEQAIGLDAPKEIVLPDGTRVNVVLSQNEFSEFVAKAFSFSHRSDYKPSRNELNAGIVQTAILTPVGTGVLVQEYDGLDPTPLIDIMLKELTKEEVDYGYDYREREVSQTVGDKTLKGRQAVTSYKDETWTRSVYAYGGRDSGLLIVTFLEDEYRETEEELLEVFWQTLKIH